MTIKLPEAVERSIRAAVEEGRFASAEQAVEAAWRVHEQGFRPEAGPEGRELPEAFHRRLLADGVLAGLPDPSRDVDDDDEPTAVEGESPSGSIIGERR